MDYSQLVLPLHQYEDSPFVVPGNGSLPSTFAISQASKPSFTTAQVILLLSSSAVLLLLFPIRAFQLHRASLKVLPNHTGAIKAVCYWRPQRTPTNSVAGGYCYHRSSRIGISDYMPDV
jgi:hypothetical protein